MNKFRLIASIICPVITVFLLIGDIIYSNELICGTKELSEIEQTITKLDEENQTLSVQIAELSSLEIIGKKAVAMGFLPSPKILTLNPEGAPVAFQYR